MKSTKRGTFNIKINNKAIKRKPKNNKTGSEGIIGSPDMTSGLYIDDIDIMLCTNHSELSNGPKQVAAHIKLE